MGKSESLVFVMGAEEQVLLSLKDLGGILVMEYMLVFDNGIKVGLTS